MIPIWFVRLCLFPEGGKILILVLITAPKFLLTAEAKVYQLSRIFD